MSKHDEEDPVWMAVYEGRQAVYAHHFGSIERNVQKLMNLMGVWPGGCLVQIWAPRLGCWVTSSLGLTNLGMPARTTTDNFQIQTNGVESGVRYSSRLLSRDRRVVPSDMAGYGYELLVLTRKRLSGPSCS